MSDENTPQEVIQEPVVLEEETVVTAEEFEDLAEIAALLKTPEQRRALVESLLIAHGEPLTKERLMEVTFFSEADIELALTDLRTVLDEGQRGVELVRLGDAYQVRTRASFAPFVRGLKASAPKRLSQPALETLAIVAYRQPIVKSDIEKIRGVDATPTIKTLLDRDLIKIVGHQSTPGQPALYGTTEGFLKLFGLASLEQLPSLRDLKEIEKEPGESPAAVA